MSPSGFEATNNGDTDALAVYGTSSFIYAPLYCLWMEHVLITFAMLSKMAANNNQTHSALRNTILTYMDTTLVAL